MILAQHIIPDTFLVMVQDRGKGKPEDQQKIGKDDAKKEHDIVPFILENYSDAIS